ncbi:MAG: imidazoleglycerol-phosphate dehydratase HisB [Deinococcota bacterium]
MSEVITTRHASVERQTNETSVKVNLDLDVPAGGKVTTGHGFIDHMLEQLIRHGRFNLEVQATGDLHVDVHHLAEDSGITLGQAFAEALGDKRGIERYADAWVPMEETLAHVVIDISGRSYIAFDPTGYEGNCQGFNAHHLREMLRGFSNHLGINLHVRVLSGVETHHVCEAVVKAFARALWQATRITSDALPSTKGLL